MSGIVFVGNADLTRDHSSLVDSADFVVRFNIPRTYSSGSGTRFDIWVITNAGGAKRFVKKRMFKDAVYKNQPDQLWFPRCVEVHKQLRERYPVEESLIVKKAERDFADRIIRTNDLQQTNIVRFSEDVYWGCLEILSKATGRDAPVRIPSTGFLALYYVLYVLKQRPVTLVGFTFEGWKGHPWAIEESLVIGWANEGLVTCVPG